MKDYNTVETEEYAMAQEIYHEPEFNRGVNTIVKKR